MRKIFGSLLCCVVLCISGVRAQALQYKIIDLDTLGRMQSEAYSINNNGQIIGYEYVPYINKHVCLWQNGNTIFWDGTQYCQAARINCSGQAVGYSYDSKNDLTSAILWQDGKMNYLPTLGENYNRAYDINNNGDIVGYSSKNGRNRAVIWENGNITDLGSGISFGINNNGQVVGDSYSYYGLDGMNTNAALWQNGNMTILSNYFSEAFDINDKGQIVGCSYFANGDSHAVLWQNGVMTDLGTLGGFNSEARAINNKGQIVGFSRMPNNDTHAFIWQNGVMTDLGTLGGPDSQAYDINDNGLIVGRSQASYGTDSLATLWEPVPEPSSIFTLFCGIGGIGGIAWRRRK